MSRTNHDDSAAANATDPERAPLILPEATRHGSPPEPEPAPAPSPKRLGLVAVCMLLILLLELGAYLASIPLTQVLEETICRAFHPPPTPAPAPGDPRCKGNDVQTELSLIRGWQSTLDYIPSLLTAVPYGFLADRRGRELVLRLSLIGITLASGFLVLICSLPEVFPPRATWASAIFTFIGGGPAVFNAMVFTIAADIVSEEQRSTAFSYLAAAVIGGELMASPLVYLLMERSLWLPIYLGLGCLVVATIGPVFLPETLSRRPRSQAPESRQPPVSWLKAVRQETKKLGEAMRWLTWGNWKVAVLLCTFLLTTLGRFAQEILLQYVTRRYQWSWSKASLLLSIRASLNLALLAIIVPSASYALVHRRLYSVPRSNLLLAWASAMLLAVGAFTIGLAETSIVMASGLTVFALGAGYNSLVRSLLASLVEPQQHRAGISDRAWASLIYLHLPLCYSLPVSNYECLVELLNVPVDRLPARNKSVDEPWGYLPNEQGGGVAGCIEEDLVRQYTFHGEYDYSDELPFRNSSFKLRLHLNHCLGTIRLNPMCVRDVTPFLAIVYPATKLGESPEQVGNMIQNTSRQPHVAGE